MKKYLLSALTFSVLITTANAACGTVSCWSTTITKLIVGSDGSILVGTSDDETKLNCTSPRNEYLTLKADAPGANTIYSTLLTAQTTKKQIGLRIIENSNVCEIVYITL